MSKKNKATCKKMGNNLAPMYNPGTSWEALSRSHKEIAHKNIARSRPCFEILYTERKQAEKSDEIYYVGDVFYRCHARMFIYPKKLIYFEDFTAEKAEDQAKQFGEAIRNTPALTFPLGTVIKNQIKLQSYKTLFFVITKLNIDRSRGICHYELYPDSLECLLTIPTIGLRDDFLVCGYYDMF